MTAERPEPAEEEEKTDDAAAVKKPELRQLRVEKVVLGPEMVTSPTSGHASSGNKCRRLAVRKRAR